jgi:anti-sigma factor RsiW
MADIDSIQPGSQIRITVVRDPSSAAAAKTLERLLSKDPAVAAEHKRLRKARDTHEKSKIRGGRVWTERPVKQHPVRGERGESGTVRATVDVLRDLGSVKRFIEVETV